MHKEDLVQYLSKENDAPFEMKLGTLRSFGLKPPDFVELGESLLQNISAKDILRCKDKVEGLKNQLKIFKRHLLVSKLAPP